MTRLIGRPTRFLLPALLALAGANDIAFAIIAAQLCTLCVGGALRRAAGRVVSAARFRGNYALALPLAAIGGAAAAYGLVNFHNIDFAAALGGALIAFAEVCADRLYATSDIASAAVCDVVTALIAGAGAFLGDTAFIVGSATAAVISLAVSLLIGGIRPVKAGGAVFKAIPIAILRSGLYIACFGVLLYYFPDCAMCALPFWGVIRAIDAPVRRSSDESASAALLITILSIGVSAAGIFVPTAHAAAALRGTFIMAFAASAFFLSIGVTSALRGLSTLAMLAITYIHVRGFEFFSVRELLPYIAAWLALTALMLSANDISALIRTNRARMRARKTRRRSK